MKKFITVLVLSLLLGTLTASPLGGTKADCDSATCQLPDCHCMSTDPPMSLQPQEIPHLVLLTFDDAIADYMTPMYDRILQNRLNPNGCPVAMTFFVQHPDTNYQLVNSYYNRGNEMASHTVTHENNNTYWATSDYQQWMKEVDQERDILNFYGNIPKDKIQGHRAPYLQTGGDSMFEAFTQLGMKYDSTVGVESQFLDPPIWPYTLDYGVSSGCGNPCTTGQYKGFWDIPVVAYRSPLGNTCSRPDSGFWDGCFTPNSAEETYQYFLDNFSRFRASRTPFPVYQHVYWLDGGMAASGGNYVMDGFIMFLDYLATFDHVYLVTVSKAIEWMKNPLTLEQLKTNDIFGCNPIQPDPAACPNPQTCNYSDSAPGGSKQMKSCTGCPPAYPWLDNPSGLP